MLHPERSGPRTYMYLESGTGQRQPQYRICAVQQPSYWSWARRVLKLCVNVVTDSFSCANARMMVQFPVSIPSLYHGSVPLVRNETPYDR